MVFAARALRAFGGPLYALPGNHDVGDEPPGQDPEQIVSAPRLERWQRHLGADRWAFDAGRWRLIGANAQLFGSGLPQEAEQLDWLGAQLSAAAGRPVALFVHKPLFLDNPEADPAGPGCTPPEARKLLLDLIETAGVRLVVSGHLHQYRELSHMGVRYLWLPATAFAASHELGGDPACGLTVLEFGDEAVEVCIERPVGLVSHDLAALKEHGRYAFLRDMPPCPPEL
jgi:3',5'-cyclic AMP phosphodiesterase CpdA